MAIDNTPPRLKLIVTIAVITVITLIAIDFATKSYFAMMSDEAKHEKIAPTSDKTEQHKAEATAFAQAAMPVDQAMTQFEKGQRSDAITPQHSEDIAPMTGWSKLPLPPPTTERPVPMPAQPTMIGDGGVMLYSDGGVMLSADGGVMMAPISDGGAPRRDHNRDADGGLGGHHGHGGGNGNGGGGGGNGQGNGDGTGGGGH